MTKKKQQGKKDKPFVERFMNLSNETERLIASQSRTPTQELDSQVRIINTSQKRQRKFIKDTSTGARNLFRVPK